MSKYKKIKSEFELHADQKRAVGMKKYMREQFEFPRVCQSHNLLSDVVLCQPLYLDICNKDRLIFLIILF
ncbi:MAG: hypothetical protein U0K57_03185 [Lachnospiraceae bacterium]|nr:hypothetical protein [Lachnospiraceae bacterium]